MLTYDGLADPACCEKYFKDNKHNSLNLALKICSDICPWTLSVPRSSQFSSSFALGKLFASRNRQCPRTNIRAYFRAKSRLLFIYAYLEGENILRKEQKGCRKRSRGMKSPLLIDKTVWRDCKKRHPILAMAWIDYKKAI